MNFTAQAKTASMDLFIENEQWELHSALLDRKENFYPCCPDTPFYDIMLTLTIIRKPMFALFYYVWPSLLLLIIGIMVFFLPAESGEKVSLGITVLLSLTVYQLLLSDIVPRTSEVVPVLGDYKTVTHSSVMSISKWLPRVALWEIYPSAQLIFYQICL